MFNIKLPFLLIFILSHSFLSSELIPDWTDVNETPFPLHDPMINPVLTAVDVLDVKASFVADPFMFHENGAGYMFFEVFNLDIKKGEIGLASSLDGINWNYDQIILAEPFHLSYPLVCKSDGKYYMVPETGDVNQVRIYESKSFPYECTYLTTLLRGKSFRDTTLFHYDSTWWMLTGDNTNKMSIESMKFTWIQLLNWSGIALGCIILILGGQDRFGISLWMVKVKGMTHGQ